MYKKSTEQGLAEGIEEETAKVGVSQLEGGQYCTAKQLHHTTPHHTPSYLLS